MPMIPAATLLALLWMPQAPAHKPHPAKPAAKVAAKLPAGPKTAAELEADLAAGLKAAPLEGDQISLAVSGNDITLHGTVLAAEHKGVATREARKIAEKDGWKGFHVLNQLAVEPPK
ncbi:MAG: hypothetical protein ACRD1E_07305 [Terriglobales bacterium]